MSKVLIVGAMPLSCALVIAACDGGGPGQPTPEHGALLVPALPTLQEVCPGTTLVAHVKPGASCPDSNASWDITELVDDQTDTPLDDFCVYEWKGQVPLPPGAIEAAPTIPDPMPEHLPRPDCFAVTPGAPPLEAEHAAAEVNPGLATAFRAQIEAPTSVATPPTGAVRIAIVDSWPKDESGLTPGQLRHGIAMATIGREVACLGTPASCLVDVSSHLALNLEPPGVVNNVEGGYFGGQARLARTIYAAVRQWQIEVPNARLVVNLSLGWDEDYNLGAERAVEEVLRYAACKGVLVIAAAGNETGGPTPSSGPVYPAKWETVPAPPPTAACQTSSGQPLLFAVGGVDGRDHVLANARPLGRPRLAAPGFAAVMPATLGGAPTHLGPFTGSSVAAAVTSGVAAAAWSYDGTMTAMQVVERIWKYGVPLDLPSDFCLGGPCLEIHRVSACRTVDSLGAASTCTKIAAGAGANGAWTEAERTTVQSSHLSRASVTLSLPEGPVSSLCNEPLWASVAVDTLDYPCVTEQLPNAGLAPHIGAQPPKDPCGACSFYQEQGGTSIVYIGVDAAVVGDAFPMALSLQVGGEATARYDLSGVGGIRPGELIEVEVPDVREFYKVDYDSASIEWLRTVTDPRLQTTSVIPVSTVP